MHRMTSAQAEQQLTDLADQFAQWRQHRTSRFAPIPPSLWEHAMALTAVLPMAYVAKRLRLRGRDLKKRCAARPESRCAETTSLPVGFVEVPTASAWPLAPPQIEIEVHRSDGTRLWIRSPEAQLPLAAVVRTFLETP
jgi:hypothetical protein